MNIEALSVSIVAGAVAVVLLAALGRAWMRKADSASRKRRREEALIHLREPLERQGRG